MAFLAYLWWQAERETYPGPGVGVITEMPGIGPAVCEETRQDVQDEVDPAIADAQREVDRMIAENPELAPYADEVKQSLAEAEGDVRANLEDALTANGC